MHPFYPLIAAVTLKREKGKSMKKLFIVFTIILSLFVVASCSARKQPGQDISTEVQEPTKEYSISESNNRLSVALFKLIDKEHENLVFSSFSVSNALAMAAETTEEEISNSIRKGLQLSNDITKIRDGYQAILNKYKTPNEKYSLNIANAVWIDNKYELEPARQQNIEEFYLGESLSFDNTQPKNAANRINKWCDDKTEGMIDQIISEGDITSLTHLVLANAIYFKGSWQEEFNEKSTQKRTFYNSFKEESQVDFMHINGKFAYTEDENVQVLEMRYKGGNFSMLIILPRDNDINSLKSNLTSELLAKWNEELKTYKVDVHFPKFKFEYGANLNKPLQEIGMERAFIPLSANELYISTVLHKAIIDVNEKGTEAAAATAVAMATRMAGPIYERREFNADHPFLFLIQENMTENILFMGKVETPKYED